MKSIRTLTIDQVRRLAVVRQRLAGPLLPASAQGILQVVRDLGCIQLDPINAVARSHLLVLWSRLGVYDPAHLDALLWHNRHLFEYWAHCASIVLTEDYAIHNVLMRRYGSERDAHSRRLRKWVQDNDRLRRSILSQIRRAGPVLARSIGEDGSAPKEWVSTGWTSGRNVSRMLDALWIQGKIMVARREGIQKAWDIAERCLPAWTPRKRLSEHQAVRQAAQKSLRALGAATRRQIEQHFIRGRYPDLDRVLDELEREGSVERVRVARDRTLLPGDWYIHADEMARLENDGADWGPRTTLLSPFDNLICDRARTRQLFDFDYAMEIYVPASQRKYGYYVLPILHGDRLIGRVSPLLDREHHRLVVQAVFAERTAPKSTDTACVVASAIVELGEFLGASEIEVSRRVPTAWRRSLQSI